MADPHIESVRATNDEAAVSKLSCVELGYYSDPFLAHFVQRGARRAPLINRGNYARVAAFNKLVGDFVGADTGAHGRRKQVLNLGAGFDTLFFRLRAGVPPLPRGDPAAPVAFFEVDHAATMKKKAAIVRHHADLVALLGVAGASGHESAASPGLLGSSSLLHLVGADLADTGSLEAALLAAGFDFDAPTLVLAECVLVYMDRAGSDALLAWLASRLRGGAVVGVYEMVSPGDPFGRMMVENFRQKGCPLLGIDAYPTLQSQEARFMRAGFDRARAWDMGAVFRSYIPQADAHRIERLELFDEFEEFAMFQEHYFVATAFLDPRPRSGDSVWTEAPGVGLPAEVPRTARTIPTFAG